MRTRRTGSPRGALRAGACLALAGCGVWRAVPPPAPAAPGSANAPALVNEGRPLRLTTRDGRVLTVTSARVAGDTLVARADGPEGARREAVALRDVQRVEVRRVDERRPGVVWPGVGAIAGFALAFGLMVLAILQDPS